MELLGLVAEPFDSLVALVSRLLWLHRNNRVFQGASLSVESLLQLVSILVCHEVGSEVGLVWRVVAAWAWSVVVDIHLRCELVESTGINLVKLS
jgi:hypothetical protein